LVAGITPDYATPNTNTIGSSKPFDIRDPYIVLIACKKVNETTTQTNQDTTT
jgi:hypothetical protein